MHYRFKRFINAILTTDRSWIWIHLLGFPQNLWSLKVFQEKETFVGCIETEKETSLNNHLRWVRIKLKGDGGNIPKVSGG